jgi:hypothetical protein
MVQALREGSVLRSTVRGQTVLGADVSKLRYFGRFLGEVWGFAWENKAWWLVPTVLVLMLLGFLIISGQAVAPFIYTLF